MHHRDANGCIWFRDDDGGWFNATTGEYSHSPVSQHTTVYQPQPVPEIRLLDDKRAWTGGIPPQEYAQTFPDYGLFPHTNSLVTRLLSRRIKLGQAILEIGCSNGWQTAALRRWGFRAIGIDISHDSLRQGRAAQYQTGRFAPLVEATFYRLPFKDDTFDLVIAEKMFHLARFEEAVQAGKEVVRATKYDGFIVAVVNSVNKPPIEGTSPQILDGIVQTRIQKRLYSDDPNQYRFHFWSLETVVEFSRRLGVKLIRVEETRGHNIINLDLVTADWTFLLRKS